jgi:hypothetical protein
VTFEEMLAVVLPHATRPESTVHGVEHWRKVAENGAALAAETPGADLACVLAFAALHDSQRLNDHDDPDHGLRASKLVGDLGLELDFGQYVTVRYACEFHDRGLTTYDATIGCCWDADRLDLPRVNIEPDPALLSTEAAKRRIARLLHYSADPLPSDLKLDKGWPMRGLGKPVGLWVSVGEAWKDWCEGEDFYTERLAHCQEIVLAANANILRLSTAEDLDAFTERFKIADDAFASIDWSRVYGEYQGIIIAPYIWARRLDLAWYYGWDCASGCIWDADAIAEVREAVTS